MCICLDINHIYIYMWMPKDTTGLFGAEVAGNCDQPDMGAGN